MRAAASVTISAFCLHMIMLGRCRKRRLNAKRHQRSRSRRSRNSRCSRSRCSRRLAGRRSGGEEAGAQTRSRDVCSAAGGITARRRLRTPAPGESLTRRRRFRRPGRLLLANGLRPPARTAVLLHHPFGRDLVAGFAGVKIAEKQNRHPRALIVAQHRADKKAGRLRGRRAGRLLFGARRRGGGVRGHASAALADARQRRAERKSADVHATPAVS